MTEIDREIPERERLVHDDPELAARIREGIEQAERGETVDLGSFAQHLDTFVAWQPSPADARFDKNAWKGLEGKPVVVTLPGNPPRTIERILRSARVNEGGTEVELELEKGAGDD